MNLGFDANPEKAQIQLIGFQLAGDHKVLVDTSDTIAAYLKDKLKQGSHIQLVIENVGGNEQIRVDIDSAIATKAYADSGDAATLSSANSHSDAGDTATLASANSHADSGDATTLTSANNHANSGDATTLASANSHSDAGDTATLASANSHADAGDATTLTSANNHANSGDATTLASANSHSDAGDVSTLASANSHADSGDATTLASANAHADAGDATTLASANSHSDAGDTATLASANSHADAGDTATLASANSHTDTKVPNATRGASLLGKANGNFEVVNFASADINGNADQAPALSDGVIFYVDATALTLNRNILPSLTGATEARSMTFKVVTPTSGTGKSYSLVANITVALTSKLIVVAIFKSGAWQIGSITPYT